MENQIKVSEWLDNHILKNQKIRLEKLIEIKAPDVMLEQLRESIVKLENGIRGYDVKKGDEDCLNYKVISFESKKGNGGKQFWSIVTDSGLVNYFPRARFGRYVSKSN